MDIQPSLLRCSLSVMAKVCLLCALAQTPDDPTRPDGDGPPDFGGPPPFGPRGFGPGPGGFGGVREKEQLVKKFDKDGDGRLNAEERKAAREFLSQESNQGGRRRGPRGGFRGPGGGREADEPTSPGPKLVPADVKSYPDAPLYDPSIVRTLFLQFEDGDWEKELAEFKNTDVEVPAKLIVDGKLYEDVGVHFRGMSSFMMVGEGRKRSLSLSMDFVRKDQNLGGYRTLHLLNSHEDPTFLRSVLSYQIDRDYLPAPKANLVRVAINGECWGVYANVEQYNKEFVKEWFGTTKGARWKVPGSPGGRGSLSYLGDDAAAYKRIYELKTKDNPKSWADLVNLCKTLNETPADKLEAALAPILDLDAALKFLALDNALVNNDGYWIRTSDYDIYEDTQGRFHILPQDSNETFMRPESPGFGGPGGRRGFGGPGGPGGFSAPPSSADQPRGQGNGGADSKGAQDRRPDNPQDGRGPAQLRAESGSWWGQRRGPGGMMRAAIKGVELDPLIAAMDADKPLASKLLAVPSLKARYLADVREIAQNWLDWSKLGPVAKQYHSLIADYVKADTRKLYSTQAFLDGLEGDSPDSGGFGPGRPVISLKSFADQRRAYLLNYVEGKGVEKSQ